MINLLVILLCCFRHSSEIYLSEDPASKSLTKLISNVFLDMPKCVVVVLSDYSLLDLPSGYVYLKTNSNSSNLFSILRASYRMKCTGYLVDENSAVYFLTTLGKARSSAPERHTPRIIFIPNQMGNYSQTVFKHPESSYVPDMIVIQILYGGQYEGDVGMAVITNSFQGNFISKEGEILGVWPTDDIIFFPDKLKNLNGKEITLATLHYPPYVLLQPKFDGMEARIIHEFCRLHNCKVSVLSDDYLWGEIFENNTGVGVSGNVYMNHADIGIGALYLWEYEYHYIDFSQPYLNTKVTVLVPKPGQIAEWRVPFLPFTFTLWALQITSIMTAAIVLYIVNKVSYRIAHELMLGGEFASSGGILLRALAMSLLQPPPSRLPSGSPLRRFFTIFELLFLFFTTIYSGALSSVLTVPRYYPPIDTHWQLYKAGIPWAADHDAWVFSIRGATEQPLKGIAERFEAHPSEALIVLSKKGGYGFSIEIMAAGHVTQTKHLTGEMLLSYHVMKQELYTTSLVTTFRKGSPYKEKLNKIIGKCLDTGLLLLWETDVTLNYLSSRLQTALKISEGTKIEVHQPTKLQLIHIQGAFILLGIGLTISIIVFLYEKMGTFLTKSRNSNL